MSFNQKALVGAITLIISFSIITAAAVAGGNRTALLKQPVGSLIAIQYLGELVGDDGVLMERPMAVAVDKNNDYIFVTDTGRNRILVFNLDGDYLREFGTTLHYPNALAVDKQGRVYIGEFRTGRIHVFSSDGSLLGLWNSGDVGTPLSPLALAVKNETLLVANRTGEILLLNLEGRLIRKFGRAGNLPAYMAYPNGIAATDNQIIVSDSGNGRVQIFDYQGKLVKVITRQRLGISAPRGISMDERGRIFVADTLGHRVVQMNGAFEPINEIGKYGLNGDKLSFPNGVAVSGSRLYITDRENGRVLVYALPETE